MGWSNLVTSCNCPLGNFHYSVAPWTDNRNCFPLNGGKFNWQCFSIQIHIFRFHSHILFSLATFHFHSSLSTTQAGRLFYTLFSRYPPLSSLLLFPPPLATRHSHFFPSLQSPDFIVHIPPPMDPSSADANDSTCPSTKRWLDLRPTWPR